MTGFDLEITLLEDAVFSERSATEGGHRGLDYVPGATLLGAAAARLYSKLTADDAFLLFHSGKVRFGNALPVGSAGASTFPVPFAWHYAKGAELIARNSGGSTRSGFGTSMPCPRPNCRTGSSPNNCGEDTSPLPVS